MQDTPLYKQLQRHRALQYAPFHTPGHKDAGFFPTDLLQLDFTELPDTDALYEASGVIRETEDHLTRLFGSARTLISAGGCTLAIQAMLLLCSLRGNTLLMARNAHRSAVNACALLGLNPVWLLPTSESGRFCGVITPETVEQSLKEYPEAVACYLTSPDYYGEMADIKAIAEICHSRHVLLAVDNAHGSHLAFLRRNRHPLALGADLTACSLHKTLPVLTGGAALNIGRAELTEHAKEAMALFGSTSPSYPVMASIDLCQNYLRHGGIAAYQAAETRVAAVKALAAERKLPQPEGECDPLRVCIDTSAAGISGKAQTDYFHGYGVEPEFCDGANAVFLCTPFNTEEDFLRLESAIKGLSVSKDLPVQTAVPSLPEAVMTPREALLSQKESVAPEDAVGRIAADTSCPCPPGVPIVMPGERITPAMVPFLLSDSSTIKVIKDA